LDWKNYKQHGIWLVLAAGFIARLFAFFFIDLAFENDIQTFQLWARRLFEGGFSNFYSPDFFSDYPPVYMYVLFFVGAFADAPIFRFLTFLPAMLADLGIGFVIYKLAVKKSLPFGLLITAAWVFNPAIIMISAVWGQVESVFLLLLIVSLYFMRDKKLLISYVLFGIAIMTKPQSLFLGPVYLYSAFEFLRGERFSAKAFSQLPLAIGAGMGAMVLVSLPFGLTATFNQLMYGMGLYSHASVNAFNFWALVGGNWQPLEGVMSVVGIVIALVIIVAALVALHVDSTRHEGKHFYLIVAAIFIVIFTFSVRMHERYMFPGLVFLLIYYLENRDRREFVLYWAFSAMFFVNCLEVLRWANGGFDFEIINNSSIYVISFITVVLAVALIVTLVRNLLGRKNELTEKDSLKNPPRMKALDWGGIVVLIAVYSMLAFTNLGDMHTPQTTWISDEEFKHIHLGGDFFGEDTGIKYVSEFQYLMGARHDIPFHVHASIDGYEWELVYSTYGGSVFAWHFAPMSFYARFIAIWGGEGLRLQETAFRGADGEILPVARGSESPLFDEQHLIPESRNFMNSTYFDEIFHPRTGYEFLHGLTVFETTHPPLGKVFMSWSIDRFGMTPFGWRLPGTLFGIFMIPLIYAFARLLLKSNSFALFAAFIFTFDFMLFSHTRLATIDTFVTFFVLAMYFLMYWYTRRVEENSLVKSLVLLGLCGAAMGLAIASKWQGLYGALGLPILFFPALYKVYLIDKRKAKIIFFSCFGFFVALPLVIYVLSYIPFVNAQGGGGLRTIWDNQVLMLRYHSIYVLEHLHHPFASPWWSWPLIQVPLWQYQTVISATMRQGMSSLGNPAVWWFGIFAVGFAVYMLAKKRRNEYDTMFLLLAYAVNFLPWIFVTRLTFIYHYFPSVPFMVLLIALVFKNYVKRDYLCFAYAGLVFALFVVFYPVLSGTPVSLEYVEHLRWFPRWFFV